MAETFGEADVILRVRLDELQKQLDESEAMVARSTERVATAQQNAYAQVEASAAASNQAAEQSSETWSMLGHAAITATGLYLNFSKVLGMVKAAILAVKTAALALSAVAVGIAAGAVVLVGLLASKLVDAGVAIGDMVEAGKALDGTEQRAEEMAEQLQRIPVIGSLIAASFLAIAGHGEKATEIMSSFAISVEDGEVKVRLLAKAVSGMVSIVTLGQVNLKQDIEETVAAVEELNRRLEAQRAIYGTIASVARSAADERIRAERDASLIGIEGVQRIQMEERHRREDMNKAFQDRRRQLYEEFSQAKANAEANAESARERRTLMAAVVAAEHSALDNLDKEQRRANEAAIEATRERIRLKQEEIRENQRLADVRRQEKQFQDFLSTQNMTGQIQGANAELQGDPFLAQRIQLDTAYVQAVNRAMHEMGGNINMDVLGQIEDLYAARMALVDKHEQEAMEQQKQYAEQSAMQQLQVREDLRSRVLELQLRMAGEEAAANEEAIRRQAQVQIDRFEADGDRVAADLARKLRDLQIDGLQQEQRIERVGRSARFEQVSYSRIALDAKRPEAERMERTAKEQLAELRGINQAIRDRASIAVVG